MNARPVLPRLFWIVSKVGTYFEPSSDPEHLSRRLQFYPSGSRVVRAEPRFNPAIGPTGDIPKQSRKRAA